ncbi:MAG TPA: crossover junction endodeoxyribonuclease RuvC [Phycisphaerae bacterium]|jgi:crossover junction endodeoxyribonuclease RuvC
MDVCGIDPGIGITGYAIVRAHAEGTRVMDAGICRSDRTAKLPQRLIQLQADIESVIARWQPQVVCIEQLYAHYKHPRTAILMGHARGVIIAAVARAGIEVRSYASTQVKRSLTGNGRASKSQMQRAIAATLGLAVIPEPADVADALAVALCGLRGFQFSDFRFHMETSAPHRLNSEISNLKPEIRRVKAPS